MPPGRSYLTQAEFTQKFGADAADIAEIEAFAQDRGLTLKSVHMASRVVTLQGTVAAFGAAFGAKPGDRKGAKVAARRRGGTIAVPSELKDIIVSVHGLDNGPEADETPPLALKAG